MFGSGNQKHGSIEQIYAEFGLGNIDPQFAGAVREIAGELNSINFSIASASLTGTAADDRLAPYYQVLCQNAIMKQNFIMIRQLDKNKKMLAKISGK